MADTATTALTAKATLAGTEVIYVVDGANSRKSTAQAVADLVTPASLSLEIGTDVQAYSANLDEYAAVNPTAAGLALLDDADASAQRTTLGLAIGSDVQAYDAAIQTRPGVAAETGTTYTFDINDTDEVLTFSNAAAITVTVPPNSSVAFPVGTFIEIHQIGAGTVTLAPGSGVTINSRGALLDLAGQYAVAGLRKMATDTWSLTGDIA